ncbi:MAG: cobalt transporter [Rhodospirillaceae bacterium]|nr:MAG: cobalt transporter [Rhodospirillaceae bacterium]
MMYRLFASAMAAGLLAAVLITSIEAFTTTPLILAAEELEIGAPVIHDQLQPEAGDVDPNTVSHAHDPKAWAPADGLERFLYTVLANSVTGIAFALLLVVGLTVGEHKADQTKGLLLAMGGFATFTLGPVMGLAPELPAMPTVDLQARQIWWAFTVAFTFSGLTCLFWTKSSVLKVLGIIALVVPHIWGAPQPTTMASQVPATLAAHFAATSIVISALFWAMIGYFSPIFFERFKEKDA